MAADLLPTDIFLFKVNHENTKKYVNNKEIPECCQWRHSGVFFVSLEHISHIFLVFFCCCWTLINKCCLWFRFTKEIFEGKLHISQSEMQSNTVQKISFLLIISLVRVNKTAYLFTSTILYRVNYLELHLGQRLIKFIQM